MDTWILKMIRVVSLRRVLAWGASLVCGVLLATSDGRYSIVTGRFEGYERGASTLRLACADGSTARLAASTVWDVRND